MSSRCFLFQKLKLKKSLSQIFFFSALQIPLNEESWKNIAYKKIPSNKVLFAKNEIQIKVNSSASSLFHPLKKTIPIKNFSLKLQITGHLKKTNLEALNKDSYFRIGLIEPGKRTLRWLQKILAPQWILDVYQLRKPDEGLKKVWFFNIAALPQQINHTVTHKSSLPIEEKFVQIKRTETFTFSQELSTAIPTSIIWLSADGDDTFSEFQSRLMSFQINHD